MSRSINLFTGQWVDLPFEEVCSLAQEWGFDGLEGTNPVEVRIPGYTLVTGVPVVSLDNAPFVVNNNT